MKLLRERPGEANIDPETTNASHFIARQRDLIQNALRAAKFQIRFGSFSEYRGVAFHFNTKVFLPPFSEWLKKGIHEYNIQFKGNLNKREILSPLVRLE